MVPSGDKIFEERGNALTNDLVHRALVHSVRTGILSTGTNLVAAVSGGGDSIAMMHALCMCSPHLGLGSIVVGHVDHGLRSSSNEDAIAVRGLSRRLGLDCEVVRVEVQGGLGLQAEARRARYEALEEIRKRAGASHVLTAHTADDQAETLLLRIARGTSTSGLAGIRRMRGHIARPLLGLTRDDLLSYCEAHSLPVREDPANSNPRFLRARARHELLPLMEERLGRGVRGSLCRLAEIAAEEDELLDGMASSIESGASDSLGVLDAGQLSAAPNALVRRVLARAWRRASPAAEGVLGGTPAALEARHLERLLARLRGGGSWQLDLPGRVSAVMSCGKLVFGSAPWPALEPLKIEGPGLYPLVLSGQCLVVSEEYELNPDPDGGGFLRVSWPPNGDVLVRGWRPGDRLSTGERVSDVLQRRRIPRPLRPAIPVVLIDDRPVWVSGMRRAPGVYFGPGRALVIKCREGTTGTEG